MLQCHDEACPLHPDTSGETLTANIASCNNLRLILAQIRMVRDLGFFKSALRMKGKRCVKI